MKASISTLSTSFMRLYFVEPSRGSENFILQVVCSCLYIAQCCPLFYPQKKSLNDEDGFFLQI